MSGLICRRFSDEVLFAIESCGLGVERVFVVVLKEERELGGCGRWKKEGTAAEGSVRVILGRDLACIATRA